MLEKCAKYCVLYKCLPTETDLYMCIDFYPEAFILSRNDVLVIRQRVIFKCIHFSDVLCSHAIYYAPYFFVLLMSQYFSKAF